MTPTVTIPSAPFALAPATTAAPAIAVHDLTVAYREKPVLWDIDLEVPHGVLMAVVGPNGAGKTTLIKSMLGLVQPVSGEVVGMLPEAAFAGLADRLPLPGFDSRTRVIENRLSPPGGRKL